MGQKIVKIANKVLFWSINVATLLGSTLLRQKNSSSHIKNTSLVSLFKDKMEFFLPWRHSEIDYQNETYLEIFLNPGAAGKIHLRGLQLAHKSVQKFFIDKKFRI